ncbi:MAG: adenylosuccinate lyase [Deltaproteobacteria bacterium]|jgi:adenylosuccinate lyase|nr:adenylosuccinate lyase [Deltaproteobacteria bacterium]
MIDRYSNPAMARIWTIENKYRKWLDVELAVCETLFERGVIPPEDFRIIKEKADFDVQRINEIELETQHDVIAFLTCVGEFVGPPARFIHEGLTSSDVLDTAFGLLLTEASDLLLEDLDKLLGVLKKRAFEFKDVVEMGRSHNIHAEPITFGLKLAVWYSEMERNRERMMQARESVRVGKISGAVGTFANTAPEIEEAVCERLGLKSAAVSTQIIQRDRHAQFFTTLAIIGSSIEKIATQVRLLQHTEIREVEEYFSPGQKGSSAMPHKRNPISSENLSGLARVLRGNGMAAMENVALWHERDISHSSVERVIGPDSTILLDYMLGRLTRVVERLTVFPDNMKRNMAVSGNLFFSQQVMLSLIQKGLSREEAYRMVQRNAMEVWSRRGDLKEQLKSDKDVTVLLTVEEIDSLFDLGYHLKNVDVIFERVFGEK